jgi:FKBP-type peptidyl-prolyl cis-trans isomerase SlpA
MTHSSPEAVTEPAAVRPGAYLTLHYRLSVLDPEGGEHAVISTFDGKPATLQMGTGQFAPELEARLVGLVEGSEAVLDFASEQAYGPRRADLVQTLSRETFDANAEAGGDYSAGDPVRFTSPDGSVFSGVLKALGPQSVTVDFNHPLAGRALRLAVRIIGVL